MPLAYCACMGYEVVEASCQAKSSSSTTVPGDDVLHLTPDFAAVIDGAGSWSGRLNGVTPGRFAALVVAGALDTLEPGADLPRAARHLSLLLREALAGATVEGELLRPPTCVTAIYSVSRREVWLVGIARRAWMGNSISSICQRMSGRLLFGRLSCEH